MKVTKPKKQRKRLFQAPDHIRYKHFAAHLSPELRATHEVRAIPVRSGDTVRIMRGDYKGFEGKITGVDRKEYRIYVEGLRREKVDGTMISAPIHPSKVMITDLNLEDKWREQILERKKEAHRIAEEVQPKPSTEEEPRTKEAVEKKTARNKQKRRKTERKRVKKGKKNKTEETEEEKSKAKKASDRQKSTGKTGGGK